MDRIEKEYNEWYKKQEWQEIDEKKLKDDLINELSFISAMNINEYILYLKWQEITEKYPKDNNPFFTENPNELYPFVSKIKNNIWIPESPNDYLKLEPELYFCQGKDVKIWNTLRTFTCSLYNNSNIGRNLRYIVKDKITKKYLGVICCSSDFMDLSGRDKYIGWSREIKTKGMLKHTTIGSSIVPTQPLGYNYVGGKLLSLLVLSDVIQNKWKEKYNDVLVGVSTTSLYGSFSQYNGLKYWKKCGHTSGKIKYVPSKNTIKNLIEWLRNNYPKKYFEFYVAKNDKGLPYKRDHKQRSLSFIYSKMGIEKNMYETKGHSRGVYFCRLYENTNEFLRKEIKEKDLIKRFDDSVEALTDIWKKYASKRIKSLIKRNVYNFDGLYYNEIIGKSWNEVKSKYINEVGR